MRRAVFGSFLLLAACSGGGNGGGTPTPTPTPPPVNSPPSFTSAATASIIENAALAYQATASDPDGNPITFSIAGGADAPRFAITAAGALSFVASPNFDLPADADDNNVYAVQLRASDGTANASLDLQVTVTNSREGIAVRRVGTGFDQPIDVAAVPGDNSRVLVAEKTGGVWFLTPATGAKSLAFRLTGLTTDGERGLLGIAPSPNYATTGEVMVHMTGASGTIFIRQCFVPGGTCTDVLSIPHPTNNNHNGGWIAWGPDGNLYVAIGDGGGGGDPNNNAQNTNSRLGKILRLARSGGGFVAAPGNPFAAGGGDPYVFALGLRNPYRNSFDGNRLIIADVGQGAIEEINLARTDQPGLNFGWRFLEGTQPFSGTAPAGLTGPVTQYGHGAGPREGQSIIGGHVYRGPVASLQGSYVFGDFVSGNIWSLPAASLVQGSLFPASSYERRNQDFTPDAGTIDQLVSFGLDGAGNLYIVDIAGEIFEVVPG